MTRDDIIRMAQDAGMTPISHVSTADVICSRTSLERFAALVAAEERKATLEMIEEFFGMERDRNTMFSDGYDYALHQVTEFVLARGKG